MREIEIGAKKFTARALRLSERKAHGLDAYGYGRYYYQPPTAEGGAGIDMELAEAGMDLVLGLVFSESELAEIDALGGMRALNLAHLAIVKETYGSGDEEKNSSPAGSGSATPGGSITAPPAASGQGASAPPAAST
jgi:hypothetical protein